jgi:hypothetical protein
LLFLHESRNSLSSGGNLGYKILFVVVAENKRKVLELQISRTFMFSFSFGQHVSDTLNFPKQYGEMKTRPSQEEKCISHSGLDWLNMLIVTDDLCMNACLL